MKYLVLFVSGISLLLVAAPGLGGAQRKRNGYSAKDASASRTAPTRADRAEATLPTPGNAVLADSLEWQFGSRTQRGWRLYTALIQRTVGTTAEPDTEDFSRAVRRWRKSNGLAPSDGTLDNEAWMRMVAALQNARTRDTASPPDEELTQTPAEEWLYPERPPELRFVRRDAYDAYKRMVAAARADLGDRLPSSYLRLISGHRTAKYQEEIRTREGNPGTAALARVSPHFSGRALDIYVGGSPVSTADSNRAIQVATPAYKWLVANAQRFGFRPYFYEPWHWEYDPRLDERR
jgi:zinc D-Ala-D-Ala carboxypeptidase